MEAGGSLALPPAQIRENAGAVNRKVPSSHSPPKAGGPDTITAIKLP